MQKSTQAVGWFIKQKYSGSVVYNKRTILDVVRPTLCPRTTKSLILEVAKKEPIISRIHSFDESGERKITQAKG